jgi:hypothetical protein
MRLPLVDRIQKINFVKKVTLSIFCMESTRQTLTSLTASRYYHTQAVSSMYQGG